MSARTDVVERYIEGFRRTDHDMILSCLTDDVVWDIYGHRSLQGKDAFDDEIENEGFVGSPTLLLDDVREANDKVIAQGHGDMSREVGAPMQFVFCEVFTFAGDKISHLQTYHINVS
jgi:ketosteroid isomerase-like protein